MPSASDIVQAKDWCEQARAFLGLAVPMSDSSAMKARVKEVKTKLAELDQLVKAKVNPGLTKKYEDLQKRFLELAGEAHGIAENRGLPKAEKIELVKTVSGNLNILGAQIRFTISEENKDKKGSSKIQAEIEKLIDPQKEREFEDKGRELMALVETMRPVATTDRYATTRSECQLMIDEERLKATPTKFWGVAKDAIVARINTIQQAITELTRQQNNWNAKKSAIPTITKALEPIPTGGMLGHDKQIVVRQLRQAEDYGNIQKNFSEAIELVNNSQTRLNDLKKAFEIVQQKVDDFSSKEANHRQLVTEVQEKRTKLLKALKKARHLGMALPMDTDPDALADVDKAVRRLEDLLAERKHGTTTFQGWEGYPGQINVARGELEKVHAELNRLYFDNKSPEEQESAMQQMAIQAIKDDNIARRKRDVQHLYDQATEQANTALANLESALGPVHADVKGFIKKIAAIDKEFNTDPGVPVVEKLKVLAGEISTKVTELAGEKRTLLARRNELAKAWNDTFSVWRSLRIPSKYLDSLSQEFDLLAATYVETLDNLDTMREGITKLERVVNRLKEVMANNTQVRQSRTLYDEIGKLLKNKTLPTNQALKLAELTGRHEEFEKSGAIDTEDPSTLHPKLTQLKTDVETAISTAAEVARLRIEITDLFSTLTPLFQSAKQKIASRMIWLPDDYVISFEAEAKLVVAKASALEVVLKLEAQKKDLEAIKTKLEAFDSLKPAELADHLTRVERPNLDFEIDKKEHHAKLAEEWTALLLSYETKTLPAAVKAVDQNFFSRTFGEDKLKDVKAKKKEAEKMAAEEKYADAVSTLKIAIALAGSIINAPDGSKIADSLKGLDTSWKKAAEDLKADLGRMIAAVRDACEETKSGSSGNVVAALQKGKNDFDAILDKVDPALPMLRSLSGETATDPRAFAEKVLQVVRQQQSLLENPLMKNFAGNPFKIPVNVVPLSQQLRTLDYHLRSII